MCLIWSLTICLKEIKRKATPIFHDFQQHSTNLFTYLDDALESNHWKGNQKPITEQKQAIQLLWDQITDEFRSFLALLDQEDKEQLAKHAKKINQLWRKASKRIETLKKRVLEYCDKLQMPSADLRERFVAFSEREIYWRNAVIKFETTLEADLKRKEAKKRGSMLRKVFPSFNRAKATYKTVLGETPVFIEVQSDINITRHRNSEGETIYTQFKQSVSQQLLRDPTPERREYLESLLKKRPYDIEQEFMNVILRTIIFTLKKSSSLMRASRINLHVKIFQKKTSLGNWFHRSSFSHIFIGLGFTDDIITSVVFGLGRLVPSCKLSATLVHELTHASDLRLVTDRNEYAFAIDLLGEDLSPETLALAQVFSGIRQEGLARLSATLRTSKQLDIFIFPSNSYFDDESPHSYSRLFQYALGQGKTPRAISHDLQELYKKGVCHNIGERVALLILLSKIAPAHIHYILTGNERMKDIVERECIIRGRKFKDVFQAHKWESISQQAAAHIMRQPAPVREPQGLHFVILDQANSQLISLLKTMSLMKVPVFFQAYIRACEQYGLNPDPFTIKNLEDFDKEKTKQHHQLLKEMGF
jgi:hypothetical protein